MVEIRWVVEQGGPAIELLTRIAEVCLLAAAATGASTDATDPAMTISLSLAGIHLARADEGQVAAVERTRDTRDWVIPLDEAGR